MTIETKFNVGDYVWFIFDEEPNYRKGKIESIQVYTYIDEPLPGVWYTVRYLAGLFTIGQSKLFKSKADLLNSL